MMGANNISKILPVLVVPFVALPVHAQWIKTDGPDSVQVLISASPNRIYAGTQNGFFSSTDSGSSWTETSDGLSSRDIQALAVTNRAQTTPIIFSGSAGGGVHRSFENGANWDAVNNGLTELDVRALAFSFPLQTLLAGTPGGVFRTVDSGATWNALNAGLPTLDVRTVVFNWDHAYVGTDSGVFHLAPDDSVWVSFNTGLANRDVRTLSPEGALYVGTGTGAHWWRDVSTNPSWTPATGLAEREVHSLSGSTGIPDATADASLVGTSEGVFWEYPYGTGWTAIHDGLTDLDVRATAMPEVSGSYGYMFVGTEAGIWRRPMSEVMPVNIQTLTRPSMDSQLRVTGNRMAFFSIPERTLVSLTLLDVSGRIRATLLSQELPAGEHTALLHAETLPRGMYFLRLQSAVFTEMKPVVLP